MQLYFLCYEKCSNCAIFLTYVTENKTFLALECILTQISPWSKVKGYAHCPAHWCERGSMKVLCIYGKHGNGEYIALLHSIADIGPTHFDHSSFNRGLLIFFL